MYIEDAPNLYFFEQQSKKDHTFIVIFYTKFVSSSIEQNGEKILKILSEQPVNRSGDKTLDAKKIQELTNLEPEDINDSISILEDSGWIDVMKFLGTYPFQFGMITITPRGKIHVENIQSKKSTNTPAIKELLETSLAVFEQMKFALDKTLAEVGKQNNLNDGLYYIVLIDLSGSTVASSKMSSTSYRKWIEDFVDICKKALEIKFRNKVVYIKSIGDGSLFLFTNFDDILGWRKKVKELCDKYNSKLDKEIPEFYPYYSKIIVHAGEVYFNENKTDTQSFAVNVVFKIEKQFEKNELGITEAVKQSIIPEINSGRFKVDKKNDYELETIVIPLWKLNDIN